MVGIMEDHNIHAPTVASGPTSGAAPRDLSKLSMVELMQEKDRIEEELKELSQVLTTQSVTMNSTLTTFDGFPRDDIDVPQGLHAHFAQLQNTQGATTNGTTVPSAPPASVAPSGTSEPGAPGRPFAKVNTVEPGSPADQAGLKPGDLVRGFGNVHWLNHERLSKVAEVVRQNEGRVVLVQVSRKEEGGSQTTELELQLTPRRNWGGRGLLGCHLVPL
ncbi:hypothetical protein N7468_009656 [Penicillium chermesinum]|uniref:Probable 26S proteasome regulatory subunit p27 n=1 Tax=Penicillium chermesinum TaxID=63820 RepID=A0A9W9NI83_9EURO|nr:uncharacterized protein N7468_009656 [Penicillium chermesinum]KAJ5220452.1 hypothetical protein N7468_009656 [Penicillium chermesinum]